MHGARPKSFWWVPEMNKSIPSSHAHETGFIRRSHYGAGEYTVTPPHRNQSHGLRGRGASRPWGACFPQQPTTSCPALRRPQNKRKTRSLDLSICSSLEILPPPTRRREGGLERTVAPTDGDFWS